MKARIWYRCSQMTRPIRFAAACFLPLLVIISPVAAGEPVGIDYFYEPGCPECREVSASVIPALSNMFHGSYAFRYRDLGAMSNYLDLVRFQQAAGSMKNEPVYMGVGGTRLFSGLSEIKAGFLPAVDEMIHEMEDSPAVEMHGGGAGFFAAGALLPQGGKEGELSGLIDSRFRRFTFFGVMLAGLVDSFNPCAISTLVFFVSILALAGFRKRLILSAGACFCAGSFLAYIAIGFGLFRFLHAFSGLPYIRMALELGMGGALLVMAAFSIYDAWRYHRTGNPASVTLRLPIRLKKYMNDLMTRLPKSRHALPAAFLIGASVTALEAVCTGQVYVPTLVLVIKSGVSTLQGLAYLLLYNIMFIAPMVIVLALAARGMGVQGLIAWSRREMVLSKTAMAGLFLVLAFVLLFL